MSIAHPLSRRPRSLRLSTADAGGFSLIVSLVMLVVILILGISASQMAINEERGARNDRDRQIAFQAAEAAIKDAEFEIYGPTSPVCMLPGQKNRGRMRPGTATCFNEDNYFGYAPGCSVPPNAGLCAYNQALPAYLDSDNVDFYADAANLSNAKHNTVAYGKYTGHVYGSRADNATLAKQPISIYPPRYIIEVVPKNTSVDTLTGPGAGGGLGGGQVMFRITAMGFGANPNSQVVLQTVVSTQD